MNSYAHRHLCRRDSLTLSRGGQGGTPNAPRFHREIYIRRNHHQRSYGPRGIVRTSEALLDGRQPFVHPVQLGMDGFQLRCEGPLRMKGPCTCLLGQPGSTDEHSTALLRDHKSLVPENAKGSLRYSEDRRYLDGTWRCK